MTCQFDQTSCIITEIAKFLPISNEEKGKWGWYDSTQYELSYFYNLSKYGQVNILEQLPQLQPPTNCTNLKTIHEVCEYKLTLMNQCLHGAISSANMKSIKFCKDRDIKVNEDMIKYALLHNQFELGKRIEHESLGRSYFAFYRCMDYAIYNNNMEAYRYYESKCEQTHSRVSINHVFHSKNLELVRLFDNKLSVHMDVLLCDLDQIKFIHMISDDPSYTFKLKRCHWTRCLSKAIYNCKLDIIKYAIDNGITMNMTITSAASHTRFDIIHYFESLDDMEIDWNDGIAGAACEGHIEMMEYCIQKGGKLELYGSCIYGRLDSIQYMEDKIDIDWNFCLKQAIEFGHLPIVKYAISKGAKIDDISKCLNQTREHTKGSYHAKYIQFPFLLEVNYDILEIGRLKCVERLRRFQKLEQFLHQIHDVLEITHQRLK